jgi:cation transport regulator
MPYSKISDLPPGIKDNLPSAAQKIYMNVFNSALKSKEGKKGAEDYARKVAWTAVKNAGYKKGKDGKWIKKGKAALDFDDNVINDAFPEALKPHFTGGDEPESTPDMESYLLASPEVCDVFVAAYEAAMSSCKNAQGVNCENEAFIMGLVKVRSTYVENPKGNWVLKSSIKNPPKATLE